MFGRVCQRLPFLTGTNNHLLSTAINSRTAMGKGGKKGSLKAALSSQQSRLKKKQEAAHAAQHAERAKAAGIEAVVFDRGGNKYHGRVAAVADGAREGGLAL